MSLMRLRFTGDENATRHLLAQIGSIDGVERAEEVADLMPQMDDPDSSSAGLAENSGPTAHAIEVDVPDAQAREVRLMAERVAGVTGAALEIEQDEMRGMSDSSSAASV